MTSQTKSLPPGVWGGDGIILHVESKRAVIEYACANSEITGSITPDKQGRFTASGFHEVPRGGPLRAGGSGNRRAAKFEGKVTGSNMTLTVTMTDSNETVGTFELKRNVTPRLRRCM